LVQLTAAGVDEPACCIERTAASEIDGASGNSRNAAGIETEGSVRAGGNRCARHEQHDEERANARACEHAGT
jgi:hypothetical protein